MTVTQSQQITGWPLCSREACIGHEFEESGLCFSHYWEWNVWE